MISQFGLGLLALFSWLHPFFVSVLDFRHNAQTKSIEVSIKVFTDDLENTLRQNFPGARIDLMRSTQGPLEDSLINTYVLRKVRVSVNGSPVSLQYVGYERQEESTWCYFEITGIAVLNQLKVNTTMLYEYKQEQINIIHARAGTEQRSYRLNNPDSEITMTFR